MLPSESFLRRTLIASLALMLTTLPAAAFGGGFSMQGRFSGASSITARPNGLGGASSVSRGAAVGALSKNIGVLSRSEGLSTLRNPRVKHPRAIVDFGGGSGKVSNSNAPGGGGNPNISSNRGGNSGGNRGTGRLLPPGENRHVPDEVVTELAGNTSDQAAALLGRRFRLALLESFDFRLADTKLYRWRIADRRSVPAVVRALASDRSVLSATPNYLLTLQGGEGEAISAPPIEQYALAKLQLLQAHTLARGEKVLVAIIDGGVDASHPELAGVIAETFDAIGSADQVHAHGTAVAGAIAAHARLRGTAPGARILAARAFGAERGKNDGTGFAVVKAIDWAVTRGARVINMSFAGPRDPKIEAALKAARARGIVLIAAAGNAGPKSRPLYPAADPNVIAVTATDEADKVFPAANRGNHIAVAAPGVDLMLPGIDGTYQEISGTSFSAAEVSGTVALLLERQPGLGPDAVRHILTTTARDLGPKGFDSQFGAGLVDAHKALLGLEPATTAAITSVSP